MTAQIGAVIKRILFIGFSIQIILGIVWMCCNFVHVQDFPEPDTALYGGLFQLLGGCVPVIYLLQLAAAFGGGYFFLQSVAPAEKWLAVWRTLALLTFPFAMQCHLAVQPHSFVGTLFLLMLAFLIRGIRGKRLWWLGILCAALLIGMTGVADRDSRERLEAIGLEGVMASRLGWFALQNEFSNWPDELQEITKDVYKEAALFPENMELLLDAISDAVGNEKAREYYKTIAEYGWVNRLPVIIRQVGWDALGYTVSPIIVQLQLVGEAYDSYTGRNYENMREATPILTKHYVNYSSWWFGVSLTLSLVGSVSVLIDSCRMRSVAEMVRAEKKRRRRNVLAVMVSIGLASVWVAVFTLRGAGVMDYKWTIAVNQLWIVWAVLLVEKKREI